MWCEPGEPLPHMCQNISAPPKPIFHGRALGLVFLLCLWFHGSKSQDKNVTKLWTERSAQESVLAFLAPSFSLSVSLYPQALFPAASRIKRESETAMNPTFQDSFDDVHLLFEVRQIYLFEVQNQQTDLNNEHVPSFSSIRSCWLAYTLSTVGSSQCETPSWLPSARQETWKSSARRSFPGSWQTYIASSLTFQIIPATCNRMILSASCWHWCTPPSRWSTLPLNSNETCGKSLLLVCTKPSSRIWQGPIKQVPVLLQCWAHGHKNII